MIRRRRRRRRRKDYNINRCSSSSSKHELHRPTSIRRTVQKLSINLCAETVHKHRSVELHRPTSVFAKNNVTFQDRIDVITCLIRLNKP
jgi:hypothetical protein